MKVALRNVRKRKSEKELGLGRPKKSSRLKGKRMDSDILDPIEIASADEVRSIQNAKLCEQMAYLRSNSPFYSEHLAKAGASLEDIRSVEDLAQIP
ncbi:MAG: hypothetical protein P8P01_05930, partial [Schleiferiaceae bacterium]|nr:hypothetical protein [Schleiferiaceae bacterium]